MTRSLFWALAVSLFFCLPHPFSLPCFGKIPSPRNVEVDLLSGETLRGNLLEVDGAGKISLKAESGLRSVGLAAVYAIRFPRGDSSSGEGRSFGLFLRGGDYLAGKVIGGDSESLFFDHPLLGRLTIPIDALRIFLPGEPAVPAAFDRYSGQSGDSDVLFKRMEKGSPGEDFIRGTADIFSAQGLTFACALGNVDFPYDKVQAVVISASDKEAAPAPKRGAVALLRGGTGRVSGTVKSFTANRLLLADSLGGDFDLPLDAVAVISFRRESLTYLSDLDPSKVEESPYLGSPSDFLYHFRRDRTVTGRELACGGMRFAKGLGVHSRCRLTYDLKGEFSSFLSRAGLADEVMGLGAHGSMVFRVFLDGRKIYESQVLHGGDGVVKISPLSVKGASRLTLEADWDGGFDSGDRGIWGDALLVR